MESKLNKLLARQIRRHFGTEDAVPDEFKKLLNDINSSYENFEDDILLLQNSIEISSQELREAFYKHKQDAEVQRETIKKVNEAIRAIKPADRNGVFVDEFTSSDSRYMFDSLISLIEERKHAEAEIVKLSIAVEQNPASIVITDIHGNIEYVNPKFCDLTGYTKEEVIGRNPSILKAEDSSPNFYKELWDTILSGREWKGEFHNKKKNGDLYWEYASISAVKNQEGEIVNFLAIKEDISQRKLTEELLQNERALFRTIIDLIPDAVYVKDIYGKKILANPMEVQVSGKQAENEIIGKTDFDLYPYEQAQRSYEEDTKVLQSGKPLLNIEGTLEDSKGTLHSILVSKVPLYNVTGNLTGLVGVSHDITERKKSENELQEAHKSLSDILNAAIHNSIIATDTSGLISVFSKGAEKMLGYSAPDLIGKETPAIFHLENEIVNRGVELSNELGMPVEGFDVFIAKAMIQQHEERIWTYVRKNGATIFVNLIVTAIRDINNEITGFLGIGNDITERKKSEEKLTQLSTRLALATFAGGVGVWELDIVNNQLWWDDQMFVLYGVVKQDFVNIFETWQERLHPEDLKRTSEEIQLAINGVKDFNTEFKVCWLDGSIHNIRALATVQTDNNGNPIRMIGTNWDITEQKNTEAVLLKARQEADLANNAKSVFLANMSHEIRTPLNAIIGFSQLMNRDKHLTESQKEYNISIIKAGEHLLSLINDILELSKMEAGRLELNNENVDLYSLFADIQRLFKEPAHSKHLQFIFEMAPDIPQYVIVDDNKLRRIFINLIGNAIKFTEEGGIAVRTRIDRIDNGKMRLITEIQDSGFGISKNELNKLFKHFVQTSTGVKNSSGTGLGLALSRELAVLMGGDISVTSDEGKGSIFTFYIEMQAGQTVANKEIIKKRVIGYEKTTTDYCILVVDDMPENLQIVVSLLRQVGFITKEATNGEEAIRKTKEWNPHLILMDMRMPVMDGYEATRRIKSSDFGRQIPIVALTASSFNDEQRKIHELHMDGYIRKPFRECELFGTIGTILGINYLFEDEISNEIEDYQFEQDELIREVAKLPSALIQKMKNAVDIADFDLLVELIDRVDPPKSNLANHLLVIVNNYDYEYLNRLLSGKEIE